MRTAVVALPLDLRRVVGTFKHLPLKNLALKNLALENRPLRFVVIAVAALTCIAIVSFPFVP